MSEGDATRYYMITTARGLEPGETTSARDEYGDPELIIPDPRLLQPTCCAALGDDLVFPGVLDVMRLAVLAPTGPVVPHEDAEDYSLCEAGWRVEAVEAPDAVLGPQAAWLRAAIADAERVIIEEDGVIAAAYGAEVDRQYERGFWGAQPEADAAREALDALGADGAWWAGEGFSCQYGPEMLALAARDLIGASAHWTQEAYDTLTRPWLIVFGRPVHPDDAQAKAA
jgi:hypothetical protein